MWVGFVGPRLFRVDDGQQLGLGGVDRFVRWKFVVGGIYICRRSQFIRVDHHQRPGLAGQFQFGGVDGFVQRHQRVFHQYQCVFEPRRRP